MATEATREAFVELQGRLVETDSKLKQVLGQEKACEVDVFTARTTLDELQELSAETNVYQSIDKNSFSFEDFSFFPILLISPLSLPRLVAPSCMVPTRCKWTFSSGVASTREIPPSPSIISGRAFVLQPLEEARATEEGKIKEAEATIASLQGSKKYLEKQMREVQSNFKELMEQLPASIPGLTQAING
ncbi:unnamed protein product [Closterium sp. NIES-54]